MGRVDPPEYDEDGKRKKVWSPEALIWEMKDALGLFVGEEVTDVRENEDGDIVFVIEEED